MSERVERFTPGPWAWFGNAESNHIYLATDHSGRRYVMQFRRWGMKGAQPVFQPEQKGMVEAKELLKFEVGDRTVTGVTEARKNSSVYRMDIRGIAAPDAHLIAAAPELYEALAGMIVIMEGMLAEHAPCHPFDVADMERAKKLLAKARGEP